MEEEDWTETNEDKKGGIENKEENGRKRMRDGDIKELMVTEKEEKGWEREGGKGEEVKDSGSKGMVRKIMEGRGNGSGRIEEDDNVKKGGMGSVSLTQSLKPKVKMKQEDTGRFMGGDNDNDTSTGHVRGLIMGFEMMESGDDLKRINELKF